MTYKHKFAAIVAGAALLASAQVAQSAFINEVHYDNAGPDVGEGVEIAGIAGLSLDGWSLLLYNGSNGSVYATATLSGVLDDEGAGYGALYFDIAGLQNGGPDGIALVDTRGEVHELLSYEGSFVATDGAAAGMTSEDMGVFEPTNSPAGFSLQRTGSGTRPGDFSWSGPRQASAGMLNAGQHFAPVPLPAALPLLLSALGLLGVRRR